MMDLTQMEKELELALGMIGMGAKLYARLKEQSGKTDDELLAMTRELGDENEARLLRHIAGLEHEPKRGV